ncbi:IclR family transcriptional regulator domain-containing protein [Streptomyces luteireticuli]
MMRDPQLSRRRDGFAARAAAEGRCLDDFAARAKVAERYAPGDASADASAARRRPDTRPARTAARTGRQPDPGPDRASGPREWLDPRRDPLVDAEDAWRNLNAVALLVLRSPDAADGLGRLAAHGPVDEAGVLVLACLLYLLGEHEGARFWWQLAAGAGCDRAVYCLFLDHAREGAYDDAELWARRLAPSGASPGDLFGEQPPAPAATALPPDLLGHLAPHDHEDLGAVPVPGDGLPAAVRELTRGPSAPGRPWPALPLDSPGAPSPWSALPLRHPGLTAAGRQDAAPAAGSEALDRARRALDVLTVLQRHRRGVGGGQLAREAGLTPHQLAPFLDMLCEEEFARPLSDDVYAPGAAVDRLASADGTARQLRRTLALARDTLGAAVYLGRYADGDVHITQAAGGPLTPAVRPWVDLRLAAHASAVGKCLLAQLGPERRTDHLARYGPAPLTPRTVTDPRVLFDALDRLSPGEPVLDLREYSRHVVCSAVPLPLGTGAGSLALSLPAARAGRLGASAGALARRSVPVLLTLLLAGAIPAEGPAGGDGGLLDPVGSATVPGVGSLLRAPFATAEAVRRTPRPPAPAAHLAADVSGSALYLFEVPPTDEPALALPRAYPAVPPTPAELPCPSRGFPSGATDAARLLVYRI